MTKPTGRPRGRPPLADEPRSIRVEIRLTPTEHAAVERAAAQQGVSVRALSRAAALRAAGLTGDS